MARMSRKESHALTRERLVATAHRMFLVDGYNATSLAAVADAGLRADEVDAVVGEVRVERGQDAGLVRAPRPAKADGGERRHASGYGPGSAVG